MVYPTSIAYAPSEKSCPSFLDNTVWLRPPQAKCVALASSDTCSLVYVIRHDGVAGRERELINLAPSDKMIGPRAPQTVYSKYIRSIFEVSFEEESMIKASSDKKG